MSVVEWEREELLQCYSQPQTERAGGWLGKGHQRGEGRQKGVQDE